MKSLVKEYIEHKKYGRGLIISEDTGKITVEFDLQKENKIFQFPDSFEQYLKFEDKSLQEEILMLVQAKKSQVAEDNEIKRLEYIRQEEEKKQEELEQKKKSRKSTAVKKAKITKQTVLMKE